MVEMFKEVHHVQFTSDTHGDHQTRSDSCTVSCSNFNLGHVLQGKWMEKNHRITLLRVIPTMTFIHFLTGKSSGILSDISSDILFDILSGISSGI